MGRMEQIEQQLQMLSQQRELMLTAYQENQRAQSTLKEYKELQSGEEMLVPVGGDTFIKATAMDDKNTLIGVGSDVLIEKDIDKAIEQLDERLEKIQDTEKKVVDNINQLSKEGQALNSMLEQLKMQAMQAQQEPPSPIIRPDQFDD